MYICLYVIQREQTSRAHQPHSPVYGFSLIEFCARRAFIDTDNSAPTQPVISLTGLPPLRPPPVHPVHSAPHPPRAGWHIDYTNCCREVEEVVVLFVQPVVAAAVVDSLELSFVFPCSLSPRALFFQSPSAINISGTRCAFDSRLF